MDTSWTKAFEPHERVRWARAQRFDTAKAAAESLCINKETYGAYERAPGSSKHTRLDHQRAIQFGRKFKVSWTWLLLGEGTPFDDILTPAQERVIAAMKSVDEADQERAADAVEAFLKRA
jgi:hypothetical protein